LKKLYKQKNNKPLLKHGFTKVEVKKMEFFRNYSLSISVVEDDETTTLMENQMKLLKLLSYSVAYRLLT
jgi:hypothetical protein